MPPPSAEQFAPVPVSTRLVGDARGFTTGDMEASAGARRRRATRYAISRKGKPAHCATRDMENADKNKIKGSEGFQLGAVAPSARRRRATQKDTQWLLVAFGGAEEQARRATATRYGPCETPRFCKLVNLLSTGGGGGTYASTLLVTCSRQRPERLLKPVPQLPAKSCATGSRQ